MSEALIRETYESGPRLDTSGLNYFKLPCTSTLHSPELNSTLLPKTNKKKRFLQLSEGFSTRKIKLASNLNTVETRDSITKSNFQMLSSLRFSYHYKKEQVLKTCISSLLIKYRGLKRCFQFGDERNLAVSLVFHDRTRCGQNVFDFPASDW